MKHSKATFQEKCHSSVSSFRIREGKKGITQSEKKIYSASKEYAIIPYFSFCMNSEMCSSYQQLLYPMLYTGCQIQSPFIIIFFYFKDSFRDACFLILKCHLNLAIFMCPFINGKILPWIGLVKRILQRWSPKM